MNTTHNITFLFWKYVITLLFFKDISFLNSKGTHTCCTKCTVKEAFYCWDKLLLLFWFPFFQSFLGALSVCVFYSCVTHYWIRSSLKWCRFTSSQLHRSHVWQGLMGSLLRAPRMSSCQEARLLSRVPRQESTCKHIQVLGQIQLFASVGLRAPLPCWLSAPASLRSPAFHLTWPVPSPIQ